MRGVLVTAIVSSFVLASASASADAVSDASSAKAACVASLDKAQSQQSAHKLRDARGSYMTCSSEMCPAVVREDCARSLVELEGTMPTAVFAATLDGADIDDVRVVLDGDTVAEKLDGRSIAVDPGAHVARFIRDGRPTVEVKFTAREGEKNRQVTGAFGVVPGQKSAAPIKTENGKRFPILPVVLAGTGTIALGSALALRLSADSTADDLRRSCAPTCDAGARDSLSDKLVMSNVSLAIGVGAIAVAAVAWLVDSKH
jgi:hypothetical protein